MLDHCPVMLEEVINTLINDKDGIYIDCTVGFGGHSESILKNINTKGFLIGTDLDSYALDKAREKLKSVKNKQFTLYNSSYKDIPDILEKLGIKKVNGFLFDLGISSYQVDSEHRGFSYSKNGPLDMRFNQNAKQTAKEFLSSITEIELANLIRIYAEVGHSKKIAREIIKKRNMDKMHTTLDLKNAISSAVNNNSNKILSCVFQAIRIGVNDEINSFKNALQIAPSFLKKGGRLAVISFHSIEDRIVKHFFKNSVIVDESDYYKKNLTKINTELKIITKKPIVPSRKEISRNKRARSAKLRVAEL
tara:strand:- start:714 stop:1631 length:918 start_codon:yes stop_codon:yes gene_type:complete